MYKRLALIALAGLILGELGFAQTEETDDWLSSWRQDRRWYIGIYGGYAQNTLYRGGGEKLEYFTEYRAGHGWTIGIPMRFHIFHWLAVQAEPAVITKNYTVNRTGEYAGFYDEYTNSFIDFPMLLHFKLPVLHTGLSLYANGGGFLGFWATSHRKGKLLTPIGGGSIGTYDEDYTFDSRYDNRFDAGLILGLGVQYDLKPVSFFTEWRHHYSLTDLHQATQRSQTPYMNDTWTIQAGVLFNVDHLFNSFRRGR
jgi:hypothetical protein